MKKVTIFLLTAMVIMSIFMISCRQDVASEVFEEELVSVGFSATNSGTSRGLVITREEFDSDNYLWYYRAIKNDSTGFKSGEEEEETPVKDEGYLGIKDVMISGLSQGYWNFYLYAYSPIGDEEPYEKGELVWEGSALNVLIKKGLDNKVTVVVSPVSGGTGKIAFDPLLYVMLLDSETHYSGPISISYQVLDMEDQDYTAQINNIPAGRYKVTVMCVDSSTGISYASETALVNVYSGLTTYVGGFIDELGSFVLFDDPTPEIIEVDTASNGFSLTASKSGELISTSVKEDGETVTTDSISFESTNVSVEMPVSVAQNLLSSSVSGGSTEAGVTTSTDMTLALNVVPDTDTAAENTKVYEISLIQTVVTTVSSQSETTSVSTEVSSVTSNLADYVSATVSIDKNLSGVTVKHGTDSMVSAPLTGGKLVVTDAMALADASNNYAGFYNYNASTGILIISTKHFSEFTISYLSEEEVSDLPVLNATKNVGYETLEDALAVASEGDTIKLQHDVEFLNVYGTDGRLPINVSIVFDGNGKTVTAHGRGFGIFAEEVTFKNVTIKNSGYAARCIDVRENGTTSKLNLERVVLSTQGASGQYTQPLTIGGNQSTAYTVNITDSEIKTNDDASAYYAIITFNPVFLTIKDSEVYGWADIYFKAPTDSNGARNSTVVAENTKFVSYNRYSGVSNAFSSFVFDDPEITMSFRKCDFVVDVSGDQNQAVFDPRKTNTSIYLDSECTFSLESDLAIPYFYNPGIVTTFMSDVDLGEEGRIFYGDPILTFELIGDVYIATMGDD